MADDRSKAHRKSRSKSRDSYEYLVFTMFQTRDRRQNGY